MPNEDPRIVELGKSKDIPQFRKIVLGHSWRDVDGDQMTALCLAKTFGLVTERAPIVCTNLPADADVTDPSVMVIEGIPKNQSEGLNSLTRGNFDTGPKDQSATAMVRDASNFIIRQNKPDPKVLEFVRWFDAIERKGTADMPKTLNADNLKVWSSVLHGIKLTSSSPEDAMNRAYDAFQKMITAGTLPTLREQYKPELAKIAQIQEASINILRETIANEPQRFSTIETNVSIRMSTIDIRGLGIEKGAMGFVNEQEHPDIVLLIDDAYNDQGEPEKIQFKIKSGKENSQVDIKELLAERLSIAESLFGSGYEIVSKTGFDGHPGIIGSPRTGSDLDPTILRHAVERFFDTAHFSYGDWKGICRGAMKDLGITQFLTPESYTVGNPTNLPERELIMVIPDKNNNHLVRISESDVMLYLEELAAMKTEGMKPEDMRAWLMEKTDVTEPEAIIVRRQKQALAGLEKALTSGNAERVLDTLDQINAETISGLGDEKLVDIVETVSRSESALKHVLDTNDLLYNLDVHDLPDWIKNDLEVQKTVRFDMRAVQWKFNSVILSHVASLQGDERFSSRITQSISRIHERDIYKLIHEDTAGRQLIPDIDGGWYLINPEPPEGSQSLDILVEIGRPIAEKVLKPGEHPALHISTAGKWLKDPVRDSSIIAGFTHDNLVTLVDQYNPDIPIRIIRGGFPNDLVHSMVERLLTSTELSETVKRRIVFVGYDQGTKKYFERPLFELKKNPEG